VVTVPGGTEPAAPIVAAAPEPLPPSTREAPDGYELAEEEKPQRRRRRQAPAQDQDRDWDEEEYEREPRAGKKRVRREQLEKVKLGLSFHLWKYVCFVLTILFYMTAILLVAAPFLPLLLLALAGLGAFAAPILGIVGSILCSWVPPKSGARVLILLSLGFDAGSLGAVLFMVPLAIIVGSVLGAGGVLALVLLFGVCAITGFVLFMIFLKKLAYYLHDRPDGDEAIMAMLAYLGITLGGPVVIFLSALVFLRVPILGVVLLFAMNIGWLVLIILTLFRILTVINNIRSQI
jgi:MFS family permease